MGVGGGVVGMGAGVGVAVEQAAPNRAEAGSKDSNTAHEKSLLDYNLEAAARAAQDEDRQQSQALRLPGVDQVNQELGGCAPDLLGKGRAPW